ncbi:MAG: hypothetical protein AB7T37_13515 [Dehalococcoidia bacterium]
MNLRSALRSITRALNGETWGSGKAAADLAAKPAGIPAQDLPGVDEPGLAAPNNMNGFGQ